MRRIAFFIPELSHPMGKRIGGLGNVALEMLDYQRRRNDPDLTIYVFSPSSIDSDEITTLVDGSIQYHWFPDNLTGQDSNVDFNKYIMAMNNMMIDYVVEEYLAKDSEFFTIIHCHDWMTAPILLNLHFTKYPKTRRIFHLHSSEMGRNGNRILYNDPDSMERHMLEVQGSHSADLVIAVSEVFKEEISENFNVNIDKIHAVNNGMDFTEWLRYGDENHDDIRATVPSIKDGDSVFLFCGRLVWQKNPKLLLDAFAFISDKFPNAHLVFMGNGHMYSTLESMAIGKGLLNKQVHLLGSVYGDAKMKWYRSADALIVSSFNEPFGLIFIEALVCRTPVLYPSNVAANKFLTHGEHGLRFHPTKIDLAKAMIRILQDTEAARGMGDIGREHVMENFNVTVMGECLNDEYTNIGKLKIDRMDEVEDVFFL